MPVRWLVRALVVLSVLLLAGCGATVERLPERDRAPRVVDPAASGYAVDLALDLYPDLARVADAFDAGERSSEVRTLFEGAVERCRAAEETLRAAPSGESDDARRRRHLVAGGCGLLWNDPRADSSSVDQVMVLFALALLPPDAPLPPVTPRS